MHELISLETDLFYMKKKKKKKLAFKGYTLMSLENQPFKTHEPGNIDLKGKPN